MKEHSLVDHRIKYGEISRKVGILELDATKKMFVELTKSLRFAKAAEVEKQEYYSAWEKCREGRKKISKEIKNV